MKVLVLCDDYWHPASTVRTGLAPLGEAGFEFDFIEDATEWSAESLAGYPVVLLAKSNEISAAVRETWVSEEVAAAFATYVEEGGGLLTVHSGTVGYREIPVMHDLLGGGFTHHPKQCPVTVEPLAGHALTAGSESFTLMDEHYFMETADVDVDPFLTSTSKNGVQPAGWRRSVGNGRACVLTPGHNVEVWLEPAYQALLANGLRWCAQADQA